MSEMKTISPLLDGVTLQEKFSDLGRSECYDCVREDSGEALVLKHIPIPESDARTQALILTGAVADEAAANEYYRGLAEDLRAELDVLCAKPASGGVSAPIGYQIEPREGVGFDVWILMPRKTSLRSYLQENAITQLQALNLGLDLCDAMENLRRAGYSYLNLKPENVFVDSRKHFTIGDLGLMPIKELEFSAVPEERVNEFSAPELSKLIPEPDQSSDQYSLGMLLFYVFNGNRLPYEDEKTDAKKALEKRKKNDILPSPQYADYELAEIISRACGLEPEERFGSLPELKQALTLYMQRNEVSDQLLVPPLPEQPEEPKVDEPSEAEVPAEQIEPAETLQSIDVPEPASEQPEEPDLDVILAKILEADAASAPEPPAEPLIEFPAKEPVQAPEELPVPEQTETEPEPEDPAHGPIAEEAVSGAQPTETAAPEEDIPVQPEAESIEPDRAEPALEMPSEEEIVVDFSELGEEIDPAQAPQESLDELLASVNNVLAEDEQEPVAPAPDLEANEAAVHEPEPQKRKKKKWIPIVIALLIVGLLCAALAYFYNNWYLVRMDSLEVTDQTADTITVAYNLSTPDPGIQFDCIDTYGNAYSGTAGEGRVQFHDLEPGTQYTIRFYPGKLHKLTGETSISAATAMQTQIISMTAAQAAVNTTAEIALVVSGPEPSQWVLTYSSDGSDSGSVTFSGHNVEIPGLQLHDTYTFELQSMEDVYLSGETRCEMTVIADVQAQDLQVSAATNDSLILTWVNLADPPRSWTARCVGEGYDETLEVSECFAEFEGVRMDTAYTFTVTAQGMDVPLSLSLPANARIVTAFDVDPTDEGTILVKWACSDPQPEGGWIVRYQIGRDPDLSGSVSVPEGNETVLTGMPPNAEIVVSLEAKDGQSMIGVSSLSTQTAEPAEFSAHAFNAQDSELKMYFQPDAEEWTVNDLSNSGDAFDPDTNIAAVLTAPEGFEAEEPKDDEPSETTVTLVVRGETGQVVSYASEASAWKDLWTDGKYMMIYRLPKTPGTYQLEIYFDGKYVNRQVFTIEGETEQNTEEAADTEEG